MSAQRASETPSPECSHHDAAVPIRIAGSARTYEFRDVLRGMGLRWDPATRAWHGALPGASRELLRRNYGLSPQTVVPIEAFQGPGRVPLDLPPAAAAAPAHPRPPAGPRGPPRDYSRTRFESRVAFPVADEDADEIQTSTRRFTLLEITSGLPDDSREGEERTAERRLRDLRGRVKAARALIAKTPGLAQLLERDSLHATRFFARFGITEGMLRRGVEADAVAALDLVGRVRTRADWATENRARENAVLPWLAGG